MARKKQPAVLKQYQLCGSRQGEQSMMQSNKGKKNNNNKKQSVTQKGEQVEKVERTEGGSEVGEEKDLSLFPHERKMEGRWVKSVKGRGRV